jgi:hypothetical protein
MTLVMAGPTLNGSGDRAAGRSAWLRAASADGRLGGHGGPGDVHRQGFQRLHLIRAGHDEGIRGLGLRPGVQLRLELRFGLRF